MTDEKLLQGLRDHDKTAIQYIFTKLFPMVYDLVRRNGGGSRPDAEDIYMNTIEVMYLKVQEEDFQLTCAFSTLFYEIAKRQWLRQLYKIKPTSRVTISLQNELIADHDLFIAFEKRDRHLLYREKFALLSEGCQQVLQLWLDKLSMQQIADKLGFASDKYARKRKFNCKKKLMELIQSDDRFNELRP